MPIFKWIRDLFGIRKDLIEVKKTKLEIKQLKDEQREPNIIEKADIEDIKKYDPKLQALLSIINVCKARTSNLMKARRKRRLLLPILMVIFLILLILFLILKVFS